MATRQDPLLQKVAKIPLAGRTWFRDYADSDVQPALSNIGQHYKNVYFKRHVTFDKDKTGIILISKRPGLYAADTMTGMTAGFSASPSQYGADWVGVYQSDTNEVKMYIDGSATDTLSVTAPVAANRPLIYEDTSGTPQYAFLVYAGVETNRKVFAGASGALAAIVDVDFPPVENLFGDFVYQNGYVYVFDGVRGRIYNSDINDPTAWTATSFLSVQSKGLGRSLQLYKDKITAFGKNYIEFFEDVGNATGSPLQAIPYRRIVDYGITGGGGATAAQARGQKQIFAGRDTIFWINNPALGTGPGVFTFESYQVRKLSTPEVDLDLERNVNNEPIIGGILSVFGIPHLVVHTGENTSPNYIWLYNFELDCWYTWESNIFTNPILAIAGEFIYFSSQHAY